MFRRKPDLVAELLGDGFEFDVPGFARAHLGSADLPDPRPTEYRADAVIVLHSDERPVLAVVVEVQLGRDLDKRFSWPVYVTTLRARLRCPTVLLAVSTDAGVARWCRKPIETGHPGLVMAPLVLGPEAIDEANPIAAVWRSAEGAVLYHVVHPNNPDFTNLLNALTGTDRDQVGLYADLVISLLSPALAKKLEELMSAHPYLSDFAGNYYLRGEAAGEIRGEAAGEARGEARGKILAKQDAVLDFLDARGLVVSDLLRSQIRDITDRDKLDQWVRRAAGVKRADDLLLEPSKRSKPRVLGRWRTRRSS
jgi:hypothetical protein